MGRARRLPLGNVHLGKEMHDLDELERRKAALTDEIARLEKDVTQMIKIKRYWADRDIPDLVA